MALNFRFDQCIPLDDDITLKRALDDDIIFRLAIDDDVTFI